MTQSMSQQHISRLLKTNNHYDVLGVSAKASKQEIRQAYKNNALKYHPDKNSLPEAKQLFHKVNNAYNQLNDPNSKAQFDQSLKKDHASSNQSRTFRNSTQQASKSQGQKQKPSAPQPQPDWKRANKPDYSKYFQPPKNPSQSKKPETNTQQTFASDEPERRRTATRLRSQRSNWTGVIFTFIAFFLFWNFVPDFTTSRPKDKSPLFLLQKSRDYSLLVKTSRYKFKYYIRPENLNQTVIYDAQVEDFTLKKLQKQCGQSLELKQRYQKLMQTDKSNTQFWEQQMSSVNYKPCKRILKLTKKYPNIEFQKFKHLLIK